MYPFAPLADAMGMSEAQACRTLKLSGSTEQRYRQQGVTERVADRLAVAAGFVPYDIWPEMLDHHIERTEAEQRERNAAKMRRYRKRPAARKAHREQSAAYYRENLDYIKARRKAYYEANRDRLVAVARANRAKKVAA